MANSFGGSIKLTGESDYRKALKDITGDLRLMSSEMKVMATSTDSSGKASDADKQRKIALSKAIEEQRGKLNDLSKALQDSNAKNGENSDSSKRLQTQINNATANLNKMETQLGSTGGETKKLGDDMDGTGKKASIFGDVLKANLASEAIIAGVKGIANGVKELAGGFVSLVGSSVKAYADYEQLVGGVETLFKDSAGQVQKYAQDAYKTAGLSANQYMEQATSFSATLLQGLGGDTAKASEYADKAIRDMSDNANKMGTDISLIQNAYQGFAKDNYTMLDNLKLGYGGTQEEMARLINDTGVMGEGFKATAENVKDIPFNKIIEGIGKVQDELGITGTTAKEATETISGSFNAVKASWENVLISFGSDEVEPVEEAISALIENATNLANNVLDLLPLVVDGIGMLFEGIVTQLPSLLSQLLPQVMATFEMLIQTIATVLPQIIPVIFQLITLLTTTLVNNLPTIIKAGVDVLLALINGLVTTIPQLIPVIVTAIGTIVKSLLDNLPAIIEGGIKLLVALVEGLAKALPELIKMIPTIITTIIQVLTKPEMIKLLLKASLDIIVALAKGLISSIVEIVKAVPQIITAIVNGLKNGLGTLASVGGDLVRGIWNGISNATGWIMDKIKGFGTSVLNGIKSFFGIKSPSRLFRDEIGKNLALGVGVGFEDNMKSVTQDMKDALPSSFDTDVQLNSSVLSGSIAEGTSLASQIRQDNLVTAMQEALKSVKIELDDKPLGSFVTQTVEGAVYG